MMKFCTFSSEKPLAGMAVSSFTQSEMETWAMVRFLGIASLQGIITRKKRSNEERGKERQDAIFWMRGNERKNGIVGQIAGRVTGMVERPGRAGVSRRSDLSRALS